MKKLLFCGLGLAASLHFAAPTAFAQPDPNNTPKAENPQNRGGARPDRMRPRGQEMTPEQREQWMAQRNQAQLRRMGITDAAQIAALTKYMEYGDGPALGGPGAGGFGRGMMGAMGGRQNRRGQNAENAPAGAANGAGANVDRQAQREQRQRNRNMAPEAPAPEL